MGDQGADQAEAEARALKKSRKGKTAEAEAAAWVEEDEDAEEDLVRAGATWRREGSKLCEGPCRLTPYAEPLPPPPSPPAPTPPEA